MNALIYLRNYQSHFTNFTFDNIIIEDGNRILKISLRSLSAEEKSKRTPSEQNLIAWACDAIVVGTVREEPVGKCYPVTDDKIKK